MESSKVDIRREDKTIRAFTIPNQDDIVNEEVRITSFKAIKDHQEEQKTADILLTKRKHLLIEGPNGIGKSTFIDSLIKGTAEGISMTEGVRIGIYKQDFSMLNPEETVYQSLCEMAKQADGKIMEQHIRSVAAGFLITNQHIYSKIGMLSEGQKGLVSFARLVLQKPGLLILDEPTNHINFRHLPRIAEALNEYNGMMILVSHVADFVAQIRIDYVLDMEK
jgi:ATPase subunit of ABC transporter with duplicated ATPase domains